MTANEKQTRLDEILGARLRELNARKFRELLLIVGPVALLVAAVVWVALRFVEPAPPKTLVMSTGGQSGGYYQAGLRYAAILKRHGITLDVRQSAGSLENVARLKDAGSGVSVALVQGGISNSKETPGLVSLGRMFVEPLWVFYRGAETIDRLHQLKGKTIAVAPEGSGTRHLTMALLAPNQVTAETATLLPISGKEAADALLDGRADAVFLALSPEAPIVQALLRSPEIKLMSFAQGDAYTRLFPFLQRIVLPQGAIDLVRNVPPQDVTLVAPVAALVAREGLHPALTGLLIEAAREVHGAGGLFHRVGEFPRALDPEFDVSDDAERYYKSGPSALKRNLPFWLATFIERMIVIAVPLAGALVPLFKIGPWLYRERVRRRLFYWYGRLKALEAGVAGDRERINVAEFRAEADKIEEAVSVLPIPITFADQHYTLRAAIDLVRQRLSAYEPGKV